MTIPLKSSCSLWRCACVFRTSEQVKKNEQVITQVEFLPIEELKAKRENMENLVAVVLDISICS